MRTVLKNNSEAINYFANNVQDNGCNQTRSIFFEGNKIYSYGYHYLLGLRLKNALIINDNGYSVSTSKHISELRNASTHLTTFSLSSISIDSVFKNIVINNQKIKKAWKHKLFYANQIIRQFNEYQKFLEFCKNNKKTKDQIKKYYSGVKATKKCSMYNDIKKIHDNIKIVYNDLLVQDNLRTKRIAADQLVKNEKNIAIFRNEPKKRPFIRLTHSILRITENKEFIQSEKGVQLPIKLCLDFLNLLYKGENLIGQKLGHYTINSWDGNLLKINCHTFENAELKNIIKLINYQKTLETLTNNLKK